MKTGTLLSISLMILAVASSCALAGFPVSNRPIESYAAALGDLDGDGDLDCLLANGGDEAGLADTIWVNLGGAQAGQTGKFSASRQQLDRQDSRSMALGDLDGDGDLDAVAGNAGGFQVYLNRGNRQGGEPGQFIVQNRYDEFEGAKGIFEVLLGDLDGDGALDIYTANCCESQISPASDAKMRFSYSHIWLNDGSGIFSERRQDLGIRGSQAAALGDLDGDGDLDAYLANDSVVVESQGTLEQNQPDQVWLNDGDGFFVDSGQRLGQFPSTAVALGDLEGDGDLDAFVATRGPALVWLNDGTAQFHDSGQRLGDQHAGAIWLSDLDGDGDLDAFIDAVEGASIWLNNGDGRFSRSRQELNIPLHYATALGDLNGDGDVDLLAGLLNQDFKIWWNDGFGRLGTSWR
jgi:hypothetical protein